MEFNELIRERFSCRALSDREIPHESMNRIFEAARLAPTAVNKQPFKIWAVESPEARTKLAETTSYTFGAGVFLVVGGKNSANTTRLAQLCATKCKTYHIETVAELQDEWMNNVNKIGITAGASTPDWIIKEVYKQCQSRA